MNQGFYEQLGVDASATPQELRAAYARVIADLRRQQKASLAQGGDAAPHELAQAQVEEAFRVLADPARRRRYDALRALRASELPREEDALWARVAGALVPPAVASAAELLRVTTMLKIGALPPAPGEKQAPIKSRPAPIEQGEVERTLTHTERLTVVTQVPITEVEARPRPTLARPAPLGAVDSGDTEESEPFGDADSFDPEDSSAGAVVPAPAPRPSLKVVEGSTSPPVLVMPAAGTARKAGPGKPLSADEMARHTERLGYTGGLLREIRERRGISLEDLAEATRIAARYVQAIEAEHYESLPSATFVRGYVREMARYLGLDEERVTTGYMRRFGP